LFSKRQLFVSLVGSLLLHGVVLLIASRSKRASSAPAPAPIEVSLQDATGPPVSAARPVAVVGERPSGPGHASAGSNPRRAGSPEHGARFVTARGRADGPGRAGAARNEAPPRGVGQPTIPAAEPPPALTGEVPLAVAGTSQPIADSEPRPGTAPSVDADRRFDELARAQRLTLAKGNGGGLAGAGNGGAGIGVGLTTALSGRQVPYSPVVTAPVVVEGRPVECAFAEILYLRATVHVLVTHEGAAAVPRLLESSGHEGFDQCALRYVLAMRFSPGADRHAQPLDVWVNVQVRTVSANRVGLE